MLDRVHDVIQFEYLIELVLPFFRVFVDPGVGYRDGGLKRETGKRMEGIVRYFGTANA